MYAPLPLDQVELQAPLPVNVWDANGVLLLRKGEVIRDAAHRNLLQSRNPMVEAEELRQWTFRYTAAIDRKLRGNEPLEAIAGVARPMGVVPVKTELERPLAERWLDLHSALGLLQHQGEAAQDFLPRLTQAEQRLRSLLDTRVDDSLFLLVQMLHDRGMGYTTTHALLCAVLCQLVSGTLGWSQEPRQSLLRAALTMNIGMSRLHNELFNQPAPLTDEDRAAIAAHPVAGAQLLQRQGVSDATWLHLVRQHHSQAVAQAQPDGSLAALLQLLGLADVYVACISPRVSRRALPPQRAARDAYLGANGQPTPLGAAFIKTLGMYIPGSYVKLANGEIGVVVRRGRRANVPLVFALVGSHGMPLGEPALRDTRDAGLEVSSGLVADEVKVRINPARLLARL